MVPLRLPTPGPDCRLGKTCSSDPDLSFVILTVDEHPVLDPIGRQPEARGVRHRSLHHPATNHSAPATELDGIARTGARVRVEQTTRPRALVAFHGHPPDCGSPRAPSSSAYAPEGWTRRTSTAAAKQAQRINGPPLCRQGMTEPLDTPPRRGTEVSRPLLRLQDDGPGGPGPRMVTPARISP